MSTASTVARALHRYMVKSSDGVFRARLVVPICDWPRILDENDHDDDYDPLMLAIDESTGRTRLSAGVLVTELAGPRNTHRVLCVMARTASVFVDVLHRLLCGLAGDRESVATRLLVCKADFESATAGNGRGGIEAAVEQIRRIAAVNISVGFERFYVYPLAGETAIRIVGRPSAVVHCVCLVNELLSETTTAAAVRLVAADRRMIRRRETATYRPASASRPNNFGWSVFVPPTDEYLLLSPTATSAYWPSTNSRPATSVWGAHRSDQNSPRSPTDNNSECSNANSRLNTPILATWENLMENYTSESPTDIHSTRSGAYYRPPTSAWDVRLASQYSSISPIDTNSDFSEDDLRPSIPIWKVPKRLPNQYLPQSFTNTIRNSPATNPRLPTSIWNASERLPDQYSPQKLTNITTDSPAANPWPDTRIWNTSERLPDQYSPQRLTNITTDPLAVNTRPCTSTPIWSVSNSYMNRNQSPYLATAAVTRPTTLIRPVLDQLIANRQPSSTHATTNSTTAINYHFTPFKRVNTSIVNRQESLSQITTNTTTDTADVTTATTDNTTVTTDITTTTTDVTTVTTDVTTVTTDVTNTTNDATTATTSPTVCTTNTTTTTTTASQSSSESKNSSQSVPQLKIGPL